MGNIVHTYLFAIISLDSEIVKTILECPITQSTVIRVSSLNRESTIIYYNTPNTLLSFPFRKIDFYVVFFFCGEDVL
jgi:hypothetical protein